jgi:hypothetical protein
MTEDFNNIKRNLEFDDESSKNETFYDPNEFEEQNDSICEKEDAEEQNDSGHSQSQFYISLEASGELELSKPPNKGSFSNSFGS